MQINYNFLSHLQMKYFSKSHQYKYSSSSTNATNFHYHRTSTRNNQPEPDYIRFRINPTQFVNSISNKKLPNQNPLYSQQSLTQYFSNKQVRHQQQPAKLKQRYNKLVKVEEVGQKRGNLAKFKQLQQLIRRQTKEYGRKHIRKQIDKFEEFVDGELQHYQNLNWDDGIYPLNTEFEATTSKINMYLQQLQDTRPKSKFAKYEKKRLHKNRIHTQNITEYLNKQQLQSRYNNVPKKVQREQQRKQVVSIQRDNRKLRAKTMYCLYSYMPVSIQSSKVDKEIKEQSKIYMSRLIGNGDRPRTPF